jgi:CBS domain-containing protein
MSSLDSIPVSSVMKSPIRSVKENDTIQQACKKMIENDIGSIIIFTESNAPAGIITEKDVVRQLAEKPVSSDAPARTIMSKPLVTIHPNASIRDALQAMQSRNIRRLLVVGDDGGSVVGIITVKDIFRFIARNESMSAAFVREEMVTRDRDLSDRFSTSLLDDIMHRRT